MKRKIALVVGSTFLCASILSGCASATPVDKYLRSFDKGDSEAASQIYSEEIKDNAEDKEALQTKLKERMVLKPLFPVIRFILHILSMIWTISLLRHKSTSIPMSITIKTI